MYMYNYIFLKIQLLRTNVKNVLIDTDSGKVEAISHVIVYTRI